MEDSNNNMGGTKLTSAGGVKGSSDHSGLGGVQVDITYGGETRRDKK